MPRWVKIVSKMRMYTYSMAPYTTLKLISKAIPSFLPLLTRKFRRSQIGSKAKDRSATRLVTENTVYIARMVFTDMHEPDFGSRNIVHWNETGLCKLSLWIFKKRNETHWQKKKLATKNALVYAMVIPIIACIVMRWDLRVANRRRNTAAATRRNPRQIMCSYASVSRFPL